MISTGRTAGTIDRLVGKHIQSPIKISIQLFSCNQIRTAAVPNIIRQKARLSSGS
jgi:hypothetical protein